MAAADGTGIGGGRGGGGRTEDEELPPPPTAKKKKKKGGAAATPALKDCANCGAPEGKVYGITVHRPCSKC